MASFEVTGFINTVKYLPDSCILTVDEFRKGYKLNNGTLIDDRYLSWRCIFKPYFKKFISGNFKAGQLVQVKGEISPFVVSQGETKEGYTIWGQTINLASYPKRTPKQESKMIAESQKNTEAEPNPEDYFESDF